MTKFSMTDEVTATVTSSRGEQHRVRQILEQLVPDLGLSQVAVLSLTPRGGLQLVQPNDLPEVIQRTYARDLHLSDTLSWNALRMDEVVHVNHAVIGDGGSNGNGASSPATDYVAALGFAHALAAPLAGPLLEGYRGVLQVFRSADGAPFTKADSDELAGVASKLDQVSRAARGARDGNATPPIWSHALPDRVFIFDQAAKPIWKGDAFLQLDDGLQKQLLQHVRTAVSNMEGGTVQSERLSIADSYGELWTFNAVLMPSLPALSSGPVVFLCLLPECMDWGRLRPSDVHADVEMARLVPAIRFMEDQFRRSPTLVEIAATVHLSPFHFHRRFSETFGLTPKHFLLECQINEAKSHLVARTKDLVKIAADCGFAHQSHFTSRFKQAAGLTPTRWRRMVADRHRLHAPAAAR